MRVENPFERFMCSICGSEFLRHQAQEPPLRTDSPRHRDLLCPFCTAEMRWESDKSPVGVAGDLVMAHGGFFAMSDPGFTVVDVLERHCRHEDEIDRFLEALPKVDLDEFERFERQTYARNPESVSNRRALEAVMKVRAAQTKGTLIADIRAEAEVARQRIRAERERCLRVFESRGGNFPRDERG